jgi:uncharacterized protein (TIGR03118 family)
MKTTKHVNQKLIQENSSCPTSAGSGKKTIQTYFKLPFTFAFFILLLFAIASGCKKMDPAPTAAASASADQNTIDMRLSHSRDFEPINLVSDTASYHPLRIDHNLNNAWGIAFSDEGDLWISSNHQGLAVIYNNNGQQIAPPVNIPFGGDPNGGAPTGAIYNNTSSFVITATGEPSEFIYSTENGTIVAAASGQSHIVADRSAMNAVYKGLAMATSNGSNYLYATNFKGAQVDVFDQSFNNVSMSFIDPMIPAGYAPFGIQNIGGKLYVTYAMQKPPDNMDDQSGPGHGYIDIYNPDGSFVSRFASQGALNSPWGIAEVPGGNHAILVGNFGDGHISVFSASGSFLGQLKDDGHDIVIEGLWAIAFDPNVMGAQHRLYFTAGPDEESHGLFGFLRKE